MPVEFVDREVDMRLSEDEKAVPLAFRLGQREYKIAERIASWEDKAFATRQRGRDWRQGQQRQYYRVRTEEGEVYELYADWSPARRRRKGGAQGTRWYLHRRLSGATEEEPPPEAAPKRPSGRRRPSAPARPRRGE
jgi:TATA-binding protein-associated factor Taf7